MVCIMGVLGGGVATYVCIFICAFMCACVAIIWDVCMLCSEMKTMHTYSHIQFDFVYCSCCSLRDVFQFDL